VTSGVHLRIDLQDHAVGSDEVAHPFGVSRVSSVAGAVEETHFAGRVAEERKVETELLREGAVVLLGIEADAEDLRVLLFEEPQFVAEPATFGGSARGIRFGIEPEDDVLSEVVGEPDVVPVVVARLEAGCRLAFFEHD
jgi:hypothetical protein